MKKTATPRRENGAEPSLALIYAKCIDDGDCWIWQGGMGHGTPHMSVNRCAVPVRRWIAENVFEIEMGKRVASTRCLDSRCVSPEHVHVITRASLQKRFSDLLMYQQNPARNAKVAAVKRAKSVYSDELVAQIRALLGTTSQRQIARDLGLNFSFVNNIARGKSWREYTSNPWAGLGARNT